LSSYTTIQVSYEGLRVEPSLKPNNSCNPAWSLRLAFLAHGRVEESQSGEKLGTPFSDELGPAAALGSAF
jgi:hypothetical protein